MPEFKLTKAAREGNLEEVNRILLGVRKIPWILWKYLGSSYVKYVTANNNEALRKAVEYNHEAVVRRLLQVPEIAANANTNANEAITIARRNNNVAIVVMLRRIEAVRNAEIRENRTHGTNVEINTHTASIHVSASASAMCLAKKYSMFTYQESMSDISGYFSENMNELRILITCTQKQEVTQSNINIGINIQDAIDYVKSDTTIDPVSNISLSRLLELLLIGINQISNLETKRNAYLQLCCSLFLLKNEYGSSRSCSSGFFNGLLYSQQSTLPNEISIVVHSKELATSALQNKMTKFVEDKLKTANYNNVEEFEIDISKKVIEQKFHITIMREILDEFYTVFEYQTVAQARGATTDVLNHHCAKIFGCRLEQLFIDLPPEYNKIYASHIRTMTKKRSLTLSLN